MTTKLIPTLRSLLLLTIAFTFALIANYAYGQWTPPTAPPPGNNVAAPLNVSSIDQTKGGAGGGMITAPVFRAADRMRSDLYCDYAGGNCFDPASVGSGGPSGSGVDIQTVTVCATASANPIQPSACPAGYVVTGIERIDSDGCGSGVHRHTQFCARAASGPSGGGTTLPTCSNGEVVKYSNGSWVCAADNQGSSGISSVTIQTCNQAHPSGGGSASCSVSCPAGTIRTGCSGRAPQQMSSITPTASNGCSCSGYGGSSSGSVTCHAYCAQ